MRLFLFICFAAALIAGLNAAKSKKKNTKAEKQGNTKVEKQGDWNMYETHPDKQLEPRNVNPHLGAEIIIPKNGK